MAKIFFNPTQNLVVVVRIYAFFKLSDQLVMFLNVYFDSGSVKQLTLKIFTLFSDVLYFCFFVLIFPNRSNLHFFSLTLTDSKVNVNINNIILSFLIHSGYECSQHRGKIDTITANAVQVSREIFFPLYMCFKIIIK